MVPRAAGSPGAAFELRSEPYRGWQTPDCPAHSCCCAEASVGCQEEILYPKGSEALAAQSCGCPGQAGWGSAQPELVADLEVGSPSMLQGVGTG